MFVFFVFFSENSTFIHSEIGYDFEDTENYLNESSVIPGVWNQSARFVSGVDSINMTSVIDQDSCFFDISKCVHGFSVRFAFRFVQELDVDQVIMSTGGNNPDGLGFALTYTAMNESLPFRRYFRIDVRTATAEYKTWFNVQYDVWSDVIISWHVKFGIRVFVDDILAVCEYSTQETRITAPTILHQNLTIGHDTLDNKVLGTFDMDALTILDVAVFEEDLLNGGL